MKMTGGNNSVRNLVTGGKSLCFRQREIRVCVLTREACLQLPRTKKSSSDQTKSGVLTSSC